MAVYDGITLQLAERLAFLFNPIAIDGGRWIREESVVVDCITGIIIALQSGGIT